jgi:hypothetical protein
MRKVMYLWPVIILILAICPFNYVQGQQGQQVIQLGHTVFTQTPYNSGYEVFVATGGTYTWACSESNGPYGGNGSYSFTLVRASGGSSLVYVQNENTFKHGTVVLMPNVTYRMYTEPQGSLAVPGTWTCGITWVNVNCYSLPEDSWGLALAAPAEIGLKPAYPNPFNPTTTISFNLPQASNVNLSVYDINGREVATLVNDEWRGAGAYEVTFDGSEFASGTYLYLLQAGDQSVTGMMMLVK